VILKRTLFIVSVICSVSFALLSALPLKWIAPSFVPAHMRQDSSFSGTVWQGQADVALGRTRAPISFKASPGKLVTGQSFVDFDLKNSGLNAKGLAGFGTAKNIEVNADIAQLPLSNAQIRGLRGQLKAQISTAKFKKACKTITGQAWTDFLQSNEKTWYWRGPELAGPIGCDQGTITLDLSGAEVGQSFQAEFRFKADGIYTAKVYVDSQDPRAAVVLGFYGFEMRGAQFVLSETGRWY